MAFLAIWHGYYPGYFLSFALEFFSMIAEKSIQVMQSNDEPKQRTLSFLITQQRVAGVSGVASVVVSAIGFVLRTMVCLSLLIDPIAALGFT